VSARAFVWTIQRCREALFQEFLEVDSEQAAAGKVREICGVDSRVLIDRDRDAYLRWDRFIRLRYMAFLKELEHARPSAADSNSLSRR
jgi:hypothetical protein